MRAATRLAMTAILAGALAGCLVYDEPAPRNPPSSPGEYRDYRDDPRSTGPAYPPPREPDPRYNDEDDYYDDDNRQSDYYDDYERSPRIEVGFFYDELSPYGEWVLTAEYGWSWFPRNVHAGWRPYYQGRWVMTEYGWTWVSYEPFGWATYHYGRWAWHPRLGWIWVPGRIWGPAWVSWQYGGGYIGWAPLPPEVGFQIGIGLQLGGFNLSVGLQPHAYTFCEERLFLDPRLSDYTVPVARNVTIIRNTTNITNYTYVDNRVVNRGVEPERVERATGRRLQRMRVAESTNKDRGEVREEEVRIYRPQKRELDTVKNDESRGRGRGGPRVEAAPPARRDDGRVVAPPSGSRRSSDIEVAPRAQPVERRDEERIREEHRKQRQELERYEAEESRKLDQVQRREKEQARDRAEAAAVAKRHAEERQELEAEHRRSRGQIEERQKVEEQAVKAEPPGRKKAAPRKSSKEKDDEKSKGKGKKDDDKGKDEEEAPPPGA